MRFLEVVARTGQDSDTLVRVFVHRFNNVLFAHVGGEATKKRKWGVWTMRRAMSKAVLAQQQLDL